MAYKATLTKRLNAAHHRWQRNILGISWKDRVTNEEVRVRTGQCSMDDILSERRLRWLGHVIRMDHQHIPMLHLEVPGFKRGPGRLWANWRSTVNKNKDWLVKDGNHLGGRTKWWSKKLDANSAASVYSVLKKQNPDFNFAMLHFRMCNILKFTQNCVVVLIPYLLTVMGNLESCTLEDEASILTVVCFAR